MALGNVAELESELIKRNREIAKARDDTLKVERRLEEAQARNADLLERISALEGENTRHLSKIAELQKEVERLQGDTESYVQERQSIVGNHVAEIQELRRAHLARENEWNEANCASDKIEELSSELEELKARMAADLQEERQRHASTKAALVDAESSAREYASSSVSLKRKVKDLEQSVQEAQAAAADLHAQKLDQHRLTMNAELHQAHSAAEESKSECEDLVKHLHDHKSQLGELRDSMEDLRRELSDHESAAATLRLARDEAVARHIELRDTHAESLSTATKRHEEHLEKTSQKAADLEGRLSGQRFLLDEANEALTRCEKEEDSLAKLVQKQLDEIMAERVASEAAATRGKEEAVADMQLLRERFKTELESHEVVFRTQMRSELDEHSRATSEADAKHRSLESQLQMLKSDQEEALSHHGKAQETLKGQHQELRLRLSAAEAQATTHQQEAESLRRGLEDQKLEMERRLMAHRLELEKHQHTAEAEAACRNSLEEVHKSKLEEKDTLLAHGQAKLEKLEFELEDAKKRIAEHKATIERQTLDADSRCNSLSMRIATLEGELKVRHERQHEFEGRLDAQRQYLEQVSETLREAQSDRDLLIHTKGSLEAQLALEASHKDAMSTSLELAHQDAERRSKELEARLLRDRDAHREDLEEVRRSVEDDLRLSRDRLAAVEAELLTARQRCEQLTRSKADITQDLAEHKERNIATEARVQEHVAEKERLKLELDQHMTSKQVLEINNDQMRQELRSSQLLNDKLKEQIRASEDEKALQIDDFKAKVQRLDALLEQEREERARAEQSLAIARDDFSTRQTHDAAERKRLENEWNTTLAASRSQTEDARHELDVCMKRIQSMQDFADTLDAQRREVEATLRNELSSTEAKVRQLEIETQRAQTAVEEGKAVLAQQQATMTSRITSLERQLEQETSTSKHAAIATEAAERERQSGEENKRELMERLAMAREELVARVLSFALERQRLSGALDESRRTLRSSLGVPVAGIDMSRVAGLEQQLSDERKKSITTVVALQRAERRLAQLEADKKLHDDLNGDASARNRQLERQVATLQEELRKGQLKQSTTDQRMRESQEQVCMALAEMGTIRYNSKHEAVRLKGALDELRYMIKMPRAPA